MMKIRIILVILLILSFIAHPTPANISHLGTPKVDQSPSIAKAELNISMPEIEFGNTLLATFGILNNNSQYMSNVSYSIYLFANVSNVPSEPFTGDNYRLLENSTTTGQVQKLIIDSLPPNAPPLFPGKYLIFLTTTLQNQPNVNATEHFQIFPHEGAIMDISFTDIVTRTKLVSPVSLSLNESKQIQVTLTNTGSGNALDIGFIIESINSPLTIESKVLSKGVQIPVLAPGKQISYLFTVTAPDYGIGEIQFSLIYNRTSGRTFETSPALDFHTLPEIRGYINVATTVKTGDYLDFVVTIYNPEVENFTTQFYLSSDYFSFSPTVTPLETLHPGSTQFKFNGITFTNGTQTVNLYMTFIDPQGNDQINIRLKPVDITVISAPLPKNPRTLSTILVLLYSLLGLAIAIFIISRRVRKFVLDKLLETTFIPDLSFDKKRVIVDGSNVAWEELDEHNKPQIDNILSAIGILKKYGFKEIVVVADAALRYQIKDPKDLDSQSRSGRIKVLPAKVDGDSFILRLARDLGALILTNDLYREYRDDFKWIDKRRIPYSILDGNFYLHPIYDLD